MHRGMLGFMLAPLMVVMWLPMLKHLLISILALTPLYTSQMSIQTMAMSNFGETLITLGLDAREILSNIWFCFKIASMSFDESFS